MQARQGLTVDMRITEQTGDQRRGWRVSKDSLQRPCCIGHQKDASFVSLEQHPVVSRRMAWQRDGDQAAVAKQVMAPAKRCEVGGKRARRLVFDPFDAFAEIVWQQLRQ